MDIALYRVPSPTTKPVEVTGGAYTRVATDFDSGGHNLSDVIFPTATAPWGRIDRLGIFEDEKLLYTADLSVPVYVYAGDVIQCPIGAITLASCGSPQAEEIPESITLTKIASEDLEVGSVVYITDTDQLAKAHTSATITEASAIGFATSNTLANNLASYNTDGYITKQNWTSVAGATALIPGVRYYLSDIPGKITSTPPITGFSVGVGQAIYPDTLDIEIAQVIILAP